MKPYKIPVFWAIWFEGNKHHIFGGVFCLFVCYFLEGMGGSIGSPFAAEQQQNIPHPRCHASAHGFDNKSLLIKSESDKNLWQKKLKLLKNNKKKERQQNLLLIFPLYWLGEKISAAAQRNGSKGLMWFELKAAQVEKTNEWVSAYLLFPGEQERQ